MKSRQYRSDANRHNQQNELARNNEPTNFEQPTEQPIKPVETENGLIDEHTGNAVEYTESGELVFSEQWNGLFIEYKGTEWEYRKPKNVGLMFMAVTSNTRIAPARRLAALLDFLNFHLSKNSFDELTQRAFDPLDDWSEDDIGELVQLITKDN